MKLSQAVAPLAPHVHTPWSMNRNWLHEWLTISARAGGDVGPAVRLWEDEPLALLRPPYPGPLPPDLRDCTVLHVGCDAGALCLEALRRGASRAVGVDLDPDRINLARSYASLAELKAEFEIMDVSERLPAGRFDVVVCSDLNRYLDPAALLDRLGRITDECLVVEFESHRSNDGAAFLRRLGVPLPNEELDRLPAMLVADKRGHSLRSYLSPTAVERLLSTMGARYSTVDIAPVGPAGRYRAVATRRVIRKLVVVAAAGRAEARWMVRRLQRGQAPPELMSRLDLDQPERWQFAAEGHVAPTGEPVTHGLVFGYDIHGAWRRRGGRFGLDELADLVESAAEVLVVTAWADPDMLRERGRLRLGRDTLHRQRQVFTGQRRQGELALLA